MRTYGAPSQSQAEDESSFESKVSQIPERRAGILSCASNILCRRSCAGSSDGAVAAETGIRTFFESCKVL